MIYSVLEQHKDGAWWYHPGYSYDTEEKAKQEADAFSKRFDNRPTMVFSHEVQLPQKHSTCTRDFKTFGFAGGVEWIAKQPGVPIREYSNGWTATVDGKRADVIPVVVYSHERPVILPAGWL